MRRGRDGLPRDLVAFVDERTGSAGFVRKTMRYVFPDHWSFLLGEVALYAFVVLIATGTWLALYYQPSNAETVYHGSYLPLRGWHMTHAYDSVLTLSFDVKAGLLMRQTHHWAANVFVAAIVVHLLRVFFTGAYRKPRELTYAIGVIMLFTALLEGYLGYSLIDDLLSGMGLAIGYGVAMSIPFFGANLALAIFGHPFPGDPEFFSRMFIGHVFVLPMLIATLLAVHLTLVASRHHTQFRRRNVDGERKVVGVPTFPGQIPRSLGLMLATAGVLFVLGGLVQINPIWQWGPYSVAQATNGAQPDWYLGWLIGALRLMPGFDLTVGDYTLVPNPFWGGVLFPLVVMVVLLAIPWAEKRLTGDRSFHNVLDRPRDAPNRTAFGVAFLSWVILVFAFGAADRFYVFFHSSYTTQLWVYRALIVVVPLALFFLTRKLCRDLQAAERVEAINQEAEEEAPIGAPG